MDRTDIGVCVWMILGVHSVEVRATQGVGDEHRGSIFVSHVGDENRASSLGHFIGPIFVRSPHIGPIYWKRNIEPSSGLDRARYRAKPDIE